MSFQDDHGILVTGLASFAELPLGARQLIESGLRQGIEITLLGQDRPFTNYLDKIQLVAEYLHEHPEYSYVLQVDTKDVLFCGGLREIFSKYRALGHDIVISAERTCWPLPSHQATSPDTATSYRYVNSGGILATTAAWMTAWDYMEARRDQLDGRPPEVGAAGRHIFNCDQAAWSELYVQGRADIRLDARCEIFQTLHAVDQRMTAENRDLRFEGNRIQNRETGARPCLVHGNANVPLEPWAAYILEPSSQWVWPLVEQIRSAPQNQLRDGVFVHDLLLQLGLHQPVESDLPEHLLPHSGKGLHIWQQPNQYARYLVWLAGLPPLRSYVEIGVEQGGSLITTAEYLRRFHPIDLILGVDPIASPVVLDYARQMPDTQFINASSNAAEFRDAIRRAGDIDLILVDGDHSPEGVRSDWRIASSHCRYAAIHDVLDDNLPGVKSLWTEIRSRYRRTMEFTELYAGLRPVAGIGVVDLLYGIHENGTPRGG